MLRLQRDEVVKERRQYILRDKRNSTPRRHRDSRRSGSNNSIVSGYRAATFLKTDVVGDADFAGNLTSTQLLLCYRGVSCRSEIVDKAGGCVRG